MYKMSGNLIQKDASVNFVIDNNVSMSGIKIQEVYNTIRELIINSRSTIRFGVFVTSPQARKLVSDVQQKINTTNIWQQLGSTCTTKQTNFYDAWGLALNEIPYDEPCYSHLVICTNGVDTTSFIYNLDSLINLLNQKLSRNPQLRVTLVQAGPGIVANALEAKCPFGDRCSCIIVQDTNAGIKSGFEQVKSFLRLELLQVSPYVQMSSQINSLSLGGQGGIKVQCFSPNVPNIPAMGKWNKKHNVNNAAKVVNTAPLLLRTTETQTAYKVWVGNLPMVNQTLILDYLRQWGTCKIETINGSPTQWAVVAYENQASADFAVKYGNSSTFHGQVININKI